MATLTQDDMLIANMVGLLMVVSKLEKRAATNCQNPDIEQGALAASKDYQMLIKAVWKIFTAGEMESQTIMFAKKLGFTIEQKYLTRNTETQQ